MPEKKITKKKLELQAPKGTRDIMGDEYFNIEGFKEKASEIALYYGFQPIHTPIIEKEEVFTTSAGEFTDVVKKEMYTFRTRGGGKLALRPEGTASVMRAYIQHGMHTLPQPVMLYYFGPYYRHDKPQRGRYREFNQFGIEVIGTDKSIADAIVIKVLHTILEEVGVKDVEVDINSMGDKECRASFRKALVSYFKKQAGKLSPAAKQLLKENPIRLLDSKDPSVQDLKAESPVSIDYLTGPSKIHFKEVLEYLDSLEIPYRINNTLVRGFDYYTHTVFEFKEPEKEVAEGEEVEAPLELGGGGRYNNLAKMLGSRKDLPAVGGSLGVDRIISLGYGKGILPRVLKKPKIFFIQLGFEAKLKSLSVIESLRKARIPLKQSLSKDSLTTQLGMAEKSKIQWVVILGQKEVIENTVIVRNMKDRSQKVVSIDKIAEYFKKEIAK